MTRMTRGKRPFYGWWITAAAFGVFFVMAGTGFYSFGVLLKPLMNEFGWSRGTVSIAQSIYLLMAAASGLLVGKLGERYSVRKIVLVGALVGGASFLLLSLTANLWYLYTLYFFLGIGLGGGAGLVPASVAISKWFTRRRGTAIGIATAGIALGAMILVPVIATIAQSFSWRTSYLFMGLVVLVVDIPLAVLVLKTGPEEMGLLPDGDRMPDRMLELKEDPKADPSTINAVASISSPERSGRATWLRSLPLWLLCLGFTLAQIGEMSILIHEVSFITDIGISAAAAATAFGLTGGMGGIGKIAFGWLTDKVSVRYVTMLCFVLQLAGVLILMRSSTMTMVWLFVVVFGSSMGGMVTLMPLAVGDLFGTANFGVIYGFVHLVVVGCATVGPTFAGFIYDATGSYSIVFTTFAIMYAISVVTVYFAWGFNPRPIRSPERK